MEECKQDAPAPSPPLILSTDEHLFLEGLRRMQTLIGQDMQAAGFADEAMVDNPLFVPTKLALIITELAEAIEGHRRGDCQDDHLPQYRSVPCELADALIRILDLSHQLGIDLAEVVVAKRHYNLGRPKKHNKLY